MISEDPPSPPEGGRKWSHNGGEEGHELCGGCRSSSGWRDSKLKTTCDSARGIKHAVKFLSGEGKSRQTETPGRDRHGRKPSVIWWEPPGEQTGRNPSALDCVARKQRHEFFVQEMRSEREEKNTRVAGSSAGREFGRAFCLLLSPCRRREPALAENSGRD